MSVWEHDLDKTFKLVYAVRQALNISDLIPSNKRLTEYTNELETADWSEIKKRFTTFLIPEEEFKSYSLEVTGMPEDILSSFGYSIAGIDSSSFFLGAHIKAPIAVCNVGYWVMNYSDSSGASGSMPYVTKDVRNTIEIQIKLRDYEIQTALHAISKMRGTIKFMFLDEALNMAYTNSWSKKFRVEMAEKTKELIETIAKEKVIPLGVFYTRAADVYRGLYSVKGSDIDEDIISDRFFFNYYLTQYSRSPMFKVYSKVLDKVGLDIYAIYIKLGEYNVIRVEFPKEFKDFIDDIHRAVLLSAILGKGYPIQLERAHEKAVITRQERELIIHEIMRKLNIAEEHRILSRKEVRKRWPVV